MRNQTNTRSDKLITALTRRETEVLNLAARGLKYDEIAKELPITKDTAKAHMENARHKLGAINKAHAIALGVTFGYVRL